MNKVVRFLLVGVVFVLGVMVWDGFFILHEGRQAIIIQFGKPIGTPKTEARLYFKAPFLQTVTFFEKRIMIWDGAPNQIPTNDKTYVYLDVTARWRISDALVYFQVVGDTLGAKTVLNNVIGGTVRDLVNKNNLVEIIRSSDWEREALAKVESEDGETIQHGRDKITSMIHETASKVTPKYGIELVDVMFKRVNYSDTVRAKVYDRMISERKRIAAEKRSFGEGQKAEIMGKVERELKTITSTANREAQEIKGKSDAKAAKIYADAYNRDPEFYSFSKTLDTYKKAVGSNTKMIISSDSEFYKYLNKSGR